MRSFCTWHFRENMFKRCRFWHTCLMKKCPKNKKSWNVKFDMKIKNRIITRYYFVAINTFRYMIWCDLNILHLFLRNFANFRNTTTVKKAPRSIHIKHLQTWSPAEKNQSVRATHDRNLWRQSQGSGAAAPRIPQRAQRRMRLAKEKSHNLVL